MSEPRYLTAEQTASEPPAPNHTQVWVDLQPYVEARFGVEVVSTAGRHLFVDRLTFREVLPYLAALTCVPGDPSDLLYTLLEGDYDTWEYDSDTGQVTYFNR